MAYVGIVPGDYFRLYINDVAVGYATNCQISFQRDTREILHKDNYTGSTGWKDVTLGQASGTFTFDAYFSQDGNSLEDPFDIFGYFNNSTEKSFKFKIPDAQDTTGDKSFTFSGYITGFDISAPTNEDGTYTVSGVLSGAASVATLA